MQVEVHHETAAPADVAWAVMTDLERSAAVLSGVTRIERLDDGTGFDVGTRWRETRTVLGREASEELAVTAIDHADRRCVLEADNRGTHYVSTMAATPTPTGALLQMTLESRDGGFAGRLRARTIGRAVEGMTRSALEQDLRDVAAAAEADAAADTADTAAADTAAAEADADADADTDGSS
jgi:carbon monoxide dehydrogenase subunit G